MKLKKVFLELIVIPNGGHLNQDSGFTSFPRLLLDLDRAIATKKYPSDSI